MTAQVTYDEINPGTQEAIASNHLALFGNSLRMLENDINSTIIETEIENLEKIFRMIQHNESKIRRLNADLKSYKVFPAISKLVNETTNRIRFQHRVRQRLFGMWRRKVESMITLI